MKAPAPPRPNWFSRFVDVHAGEGASVAWATALFFLLLCANSILKPVREALGIDRGADDLVWVWSGTLALSLVVQPFFAALLARTSRRRFVPIVYAAGIAFLLAFRTAFQFAPEGWRTYVGYGFYIWFSVFNVFALSVFWGFAADLFRLGQAKRLFALVSVGGTAGAVAGSALARSLAEPIGTVNLMFVGSGVLVAAIACVSALTRLHPQDAPRDLAASAGNTAERAPSPWRGLTFIAKSPYLRGICAFTLFHTLFSSILYFQQAHLVTAALPDRNARTEYFATVDLVGNSLTLFLQVFVTGMLIRRLGVGFALVTQPLVAALACLGLGLMIWRGADMVSGGGWGFAWPPELVSVAAARVLLSASNYATAKPARESLYTVVPRDAKYASKSFVDTFVYRGGDLIGGWTFALFHRLLGLPLAAIALGAAPIALIWLAVGLMLGRQQKSLADERELAGPS
ncbi:MAG: MFS transporter [Planctomycetota bacterium]|nr:MFS transporter [Planctomycetota bacterium]